MKEYGMDYHHARIYAKNKRKIVQPNEGFEKDLIRFEEYLKKNHPSLFKKWSTMEVFKHLSLAG